MSSTVKAHIALFCVSMLYGGNFSIAKIVMDDEYIQPLGFILLRVISGIILFWVFHTLFIKEKIDRKDFFQFILCAVFGIAINQMFFFMGLKYTTPINASLIMLTTPILVLIISAIIIKEKITPIKTLGIALGAIGAIMLVAYGKSVSFHKNQLMGDMMVMVNAISYGIYLVLVKKLMTRYHPITVVKWVFTFGIFMVFPFGINDFMTVEWNTFSPLIWWAVLYVLIGATFLTYLFNAYALSMVNPSVVSIYMYLQPVFAAIFALMMGKDEINAFKIFAGIIIFFGVYLVSRPEPKLKK